ncbi:hypothetical protein KFL_002780010 [Klebsormidium nitens]|uniref:Cupin n=1 Tax=Klebsormidium nitens TaxID=105231 RepID=A0A1Y1IBX7_KLENI|nr:hypothetical protein KFL_002780010 [Klebsormidium nitens]|eukprot:GAQ86237.1 hypothetical protein KFL_002780010 [Klebsormidium nitens]
MNKANPALYARKTQRLRSLFAFDSCRDGKAKQRLHRSVRMAPALVAMPSSVPSAPVILLEKTAAPQAAEFINDWAENTEIFEYASAANPVLKPVPVMGLQAKEHTSGPSRVVTLDLSKQLGIEEYAATSPNLLASFVRVCTGETLETTSSSTSQAFYVIHGKGYSSTPAGKVSWSAGDLFVIPAGGRGQCSHTCIEDESGGAGLYWVNDAPLLSYLGVEPRVARFEPAYFSKEKLLSAVERVRHEPGAAHRNRLGILLGNAKTADTKTLTHTLWSLLNVLPAGDWQRPHRHNSVALDLAVHAAPGAYTLMGPELDETGKIVNPVRCEWVTGSMFVTPPGWWHSHHNESPEEAWVLPMQDAGLYTHQRTLDIRFVEDEVRRLKEMRIK